MKTASRQHYRTLPIFGSFIDDFATWLRHRGLSSSKVQQHLADLQRLAPWLLRRQKRPDDLSVDDINDAERCYRLRVPSLAAVIVVLGEFLQASGRLKSRQPLRQVKPRDYGHYRQLPVFGAVVDDFAQWSLSRGFAVKSVSLQLDTLRRLVPWFQRRSKRSVEVFTTNDIAEVRRFYRLRNPQFAASIREFGDFLKARGCLSPTRSSCSTPSEEESARFVDHLRNDRGLAESTIHGHCAYLRRFFRLLGIDQAKTFLSAVQLSDTDRFFRQMARRCSRTTMQHVVATVRHFLRFQFLQGVLREPLHARIDTARTYREEQLPYSLPWPELQKLFQTMDCTTPFARRDFTILLLAASYGLRRSELAALSLDDIDWRARTIRVPQLKTRQSLLLPLTDEVGDALVNYLRDARPTSASRHLFLRQRPPAGPLGPPGVAHTLARAVRATKVQIKKTSFHGLRHAFALQLLRQGVALKSISDVLGHRDPNTTSTYLRLNVEDLRQVALPTPEAGQIKGQRDRADQKDEGCCQHRTNRRPAGTVTRPSGFHSFLALPLRSYLARQRSLGRRYCKEEWILRGLDLVLHRDYPCGRVFTRAMFDRWTLELATLSPTSRRLRMLCVAKFCRYLARMRPTTFVPNPRTFPKQLPHRAPYLLCEHEVVRLLAGTGTINPSRKNPLRHATMRVALLLLYCCGLRRGELLKLRLADIDTEQQLLRIQQTKFYKSRLVPFSSSVGEELRKYLQQRHCQGMPMDPSMPLVWNGRSGRTGGALSPTAISANWFRICQCAGVLDHRGRAPRIHDLRHSFAVAALRRGYDAGQHPQATLPRLARYLGHASPAFTHYYLKFTEPLYQAASARFHRHCVGSLITPANLKPSKGGVA
jgi:integrase/recombinase XerD